MMSIELEMKVLVERVNIITIEIEKIKGMIQDLHLHLCDVDSRQQ